MYAGCYPGSNLGWEERAYLYYTYVCTHTHTRSTPQACVFNDVKNHTHVRSIYIRVSLRIMTKRGHWQSTYINVMGGRYVCGMIVV